MPTTTEPAEALRTLGVAEDTYGPTVNTARSPQNTDALGEALAQSLRSFQASVLVVWNTSDEAVLAHSIAHYLGVGIRRAYELEGVISLNEELSAEARVALFATRWNERRLSTLRSLVTIDDGWPVTVAAVLHSTALDAVDDLPAMALIASDQTEEFLG